MGSLSVVPPPDPPSPGRLRRIASGVFAALALGLAYSQAPLYTSNQNQYFLHGAARAGIGFLSQDWLANTADPTPVFSWIVEWTYRLLPPASFHLEYLLLIGIYLAAVWMLADTAFRLPGSNLRPLLLLSLLILLHSAALRLAQSRALGEAWEYFWDGGLAGQRLLGPVLQPSVFGVLLLLSAALFVRGRSAWAAVLASLGATLHPTYLLPAALLVLSYGFLEWRGTRRLSAALRIGLLALLVVTPILLYVVLVLGPTSASNLAEAQQLLAERRIPHHALPAVWFDASSAAQLGLVALAAILTRRTRISHLLLLATAGGALLSAAQILTGSPMLALLFPWRISTVLVPASTAIVAGFVADRAAAAIQRRGERAVRLAHSAGVVLIGILALAGVVAFNLRRLAQASDPAQDLMQYVKAHAGTGELYLIPPQLQEFRLETGAAALVDFKSIPYRDRDVLEWAERLRLAEWIDRDRPEFVDCALFDQAAQQYGVTHVVLDQDLRDLGCPQIHRVYQDPHFSLGVLQDPP